ncbi:MAG: ABC transporter ATP-binding protein, partial [Clostridia bacterium]|nr:ABC transporter ATP-binding protein [Clostridia bacterium]
AGLDPKQRIAIRNYISRIALDKIVIIATHVVSDIEYIARDVILLKKGVIADQAPPAQMAAKMQGKVFSVPVKAEDVAYYERAFRVVNITNDDAGIHCRILSKTSPCEGAVLVAPTLEDYYLWMFGEENHHFEK